VASVPFSSARARCGTLVFRAAPGEANSLYLERMFLFFSNRLGCLGSLLVSAVVTLILLVLLDVI
jgi:hypothetical protein